ncbi:MAG: sigma-70 family RNA polymerase sigma factor [Nitrospirae bacterium]|nr:sigma-70 family RNA polymerase sigma factor [Nitrospirota bacterium]
MALHGDYLFRWALFRTRDTRIAEDLVQETFLAALQARDRYQGRSSERTWLAGIIKHKIMNYFYKASRERPVQYDEQMNEGSENPFNDQGNWKSSATGPKEWTGDPSQILERKEFWDVLTRCLAELPPRLAHAFSLRELDDLSSEEICKILNVSATNLGVMLYRARSRLRRCLEINSMGLKT